MDVFLRFQKLMVDVFPQILLVYTVQIVSEYLHLILFKKIQIC